jgi:hypothetical protein
MEKERIIEILTRIREIITETKPLNERVRWRVGIADTPVNNSNYRTNYGICLALDQMEKAHEITEVENNMFRDYMINEYNSHNFKFEDFGEPYSEMDDIVFDDLFGQFWFQPNDKESRLRFIDYQLKSLR